jgi:cAMP-dependent protein kinase regulator
MTREMADTLAELSLFSDLTRPHLEEIAHRFDEQVFSDGERVLRQGLSGTAVYVVLEGEVSIRIDGQERARLGRGEVFGEVSVLLGTPPTADVVANGLVRCLVIPGPDLQPFLMDHPQVTFRMLQAESRRLRAANLWTG